MLTSEILNRAADLIEERGWTVGDWGLGDDHSMPLCLEGGIAVASGNNLIGSVLLEKCPAARAVHEYLLLADDEQLWEWNDRSMSYCARVGVPFGGSDDRTAADVIEVLRAAAVVEQAREAERAQLVTRDEWETFDAPVQCAAVPVAAVSAK